MPVGDISDPITLQLQVSAGTPKANASTVVVNLTNNTGYGEYSLDANTWIPVNQITFNPGENTKTVYYKGTQ